MSTDKDMLNGENDNQSLVAEYVLGVLDATEHEKVSKLIATDPKLQAEARFWQTRLSSLDESFEEVTPAPEVFDKIKGRLYGTTAYTGPFAAIWNSLALWRGLTVGALAVSALAIGLTILQPAPVSPEQFATQLVAALEAEGSSVKFLALYDETTGNVRLASVSGDIAPDRDFELWFIEGDATPISLGVVPLEQKVAVPLSAEMQATIGEGTVFALTLEPKGGSPEGIATGPIVAAGAVSFI